MTCLQDRMASTDSKQVIPVGLTSPGLLSGSKKEEAPMIDAAGAISGHQTEQFLKKKQDGKFSQ